MHVTRCWGYLDGSNKCPIPADQANPTSAEILEASKWDHKDEIVAYLLSQCLPNNIAMKVSYLPTAKEQWDAISHTFTEKSDYAKTELHQSFLDMKCEKGGDVQDFLESLDTRQHELEAIGVIITDTKYKHTILQGIPDLLTMFTSQMLSSLHAVSRYTKQPIDTQELHRNIADEADHLKTCRATKEPHQAKGKKPAQMIDHDEVLTTTNTYEGRNTRHHKGKCHHYGKEGHWAHECRTKKREEAAAAAANLSRQVSAGNTSKPDNKPVGSANIVTIDDNNNNSSNRYCTTKVDVAHCTPPVPDPLMDKLGPDDDNKWEAFHINICGMEDDNALDWARFDDQLVKEGEEQETN
jgi:hypothetical protein